MDCPTCKSKMKCTDTRPVNGSERDRRYLCTDCNNRYISYEKMDEEPIREDE